MKTNEVLENIKARRSVRAYTDRQVSEEDLQAILEAATFAPSGMHLDWLFPAVWNSIWHCLCKERLCRPYLHQAEAEQPGVKCARQIKRVKRGGCRKARHHDRRLDRPWYDERPDRTYAARGRGKGSPHAGKLSAIPSSVLFWNGCAGAGAADRT